MTASEFAFLALGLVLGVAAGAALVEVARARPPARREIRVTVAPNSIRSRATTLAEESPDSGTAGPARGGPADRNWVDRDDDPDDPIDGPPTAGPSVTPSEPAALASERSGPPPTASAASPAERSPHRTPVPRSLQPAAAGPGGSFLAAPPFGTLIPGNGRPAVGIAIAREPDPMMAALRAATAADAAVPAGHLGDAGPEAGSATESAKGPGGAAATMTLAASTAATTASEDRQDPASAVGAASTALAKPTSRKPKASTASAKAPADGLVAPPDAGPCADQRRLADERCAVATRARDGARLAAEALRTARRDYDDHVGRAESMASIADPRSVRTAKEAAQHAFRKARASAATRDAIETAARDWLTEINRINLATRDAHTQAEQHRAIAAERAPALERLALDADAARISAESAEEACVAAREAVAACEEAAAAATANKASLPVMDRPELAGSDTEVAAASAVSEATAFEDGEAMGSRAGEEAAIIRLLRGDREILPRIVASLGGDDPEEQRRWRTLLTEFVEALVARSIEAASFDFPTNHPFWGAFSRSQCREIAAALASLGYRHDGFGDWADERVPGQRDLSLAVGYAGLDPMRIRHWPTEAEMRDLLREVTVAADEYIWEAAGALTLGELVSLLGRRADGLTDLWNDWGAVRPLLLTAG